MLKLERSIPMLQKTRLVCQSDLKFEANRPCVRGWDCLVQGDRGCL